jgi:hypothetical protein
VCQLWVVDDASDDDDNHIKTVVIGRDLKRK